MSAARTLSGIVIGLAVIVGSVLAGAAPASAASRPGYALNHSHLIGETPAGFHVYVDPRATNHAELRRVVRPILAELRHFGLHVVWAGYGNPKQADGRIVVTTGSSGCTIKGVGRTYAVTRSYYGQAAGHDVYMSHSAITVCPSFARSGSRKELSIALKHEFGHAMGLAHTSYRYHRHYQIMYPGMRRNVTDYQAGDIRGLRALAAGTRRVKSELPPIGREYSHYADGHILIDGWTLLQRYPGHRVIITVTDNGSTVYRSTRVTKWANVNRVFHVKGNHGYSVSLPWQGGTHTICVSATSTVNRHATTNLGCTVWSD